ncbi:two-partner secretion domain-containing protein [Leptothoe kymatousa]|uniref:Filamentous hemagglutinin N-terminal domain-containing protein n=1 Tax=Leptothoe kymatousa TAU-MAC 1615 TaxID=2364775 RepID=A0ABS5Y7G7_9CYAN|nr:filamentous hemagglutinin N-terminal domain-containing protein [Leptothoe kymatousa]MBT9313782.1 filamentous hemagglutinin N-terminal domain-containing protein [Leptothoe kymatousa TAU-MAC 1615]
MSQDDGVKNVDIIGITNCHCPMTRSYAYWFQFGLIFAIGQVATVTHASSFGDDVLLAQIIPDDTLGNESSIVIKANETDRIDGGAIRGGNLFHSFQDFNIDTGQTVYFVNPESIETILSRVTGTNGSDIDGLLGVDGTADLFLLNPNGITFGPNAQLDIRGAFTASTAGTVEFTDGSAFSAVNPQGASILTMSVPLGVQFSDQPQGNITSNGNLTVGTEQNLTLFGNTVLISGSLVARNGTVHLLGNRIGLINQATIDVSGANGGGIILIGGDYKGQGKVPNAERTFIDSDVVINADALQIGDGGRVVVWADEAAYFAGNISAQGGPQRGNGGIVEVSGGEYLALEGDVNTQALNGQAGQLLLDPINIIISNTAPSGFTTLAQGDPVLADFFYEATENLEQNSHLTPETLVALLFNNDLVLEATDMIRIVDDVDNSLSDNDLYLIASIIEVDNASLKQSGGGGLTLLATPQIESGFVNIYGGEVTVNSQPLTTLNTGDIRIETNNLTLANGGNINISADGNGASGDAIIFAVDNIVVEGTDSSITSQVNSTSNANSGDILIDTNNLILANGGNINTSTDGNGSSGDVLISAADNIVVEGIGSSITSQVNSTSNANSGDILIDTNNLTLANGGRVRLFIDGNGSSGDVLISAADNIVVEGIGSSITSQLNSTSNSNGGDILIDTNNLILANGGNINTSTDDNGTSGDVRINAADHILVEGIGSSITSQVNSISNSSSGDIFIDTNNLTLVNGGNINTSTDGNGTSGDVRINAADHILVEGIGSGITSQVNSTSDSNGGDILIDTNNLTLANEGNIISSVSSGGIDIFSSLLKLDSGEISVYSTENSTEKGGDINIISNRIIMRRGSLISIESDSDGNINISTNLLFSGFNENNDILANASEGIGGGVFIDEGDDGIWNFNITLEFEPAAQPRENQTNDIRGSSGIAITSTVFVESIEDDFVEFSVDLADPTNQIIRGCNAGNTVINDNSTGDFIITGRGGYPIRPVDITSEETPLDDLGASIVQSEVSSSLTSLPTQKIYSNVLTDAQEAIVTETGDVFLVTERAWQPSISCAVLN